MDLQKALSSLIIVILFIPLVFMGANVFFPDYDDYYRGYYGDKCYAAPLPADATKEESMQIEKERQQCIEEQETERQQWEEEKRAYEGWKYLFIVVVCLISLISALTIKMKPSIKWGFFTGTVVTAFIATLSYFSTKSLPGFLILVVLFILTVVFIGKQKSN